MAKKTLVFEENNGVFPVRLYQRGRDSFTVEYGKQIKDWLTYGQAARELGECLMHLMAYEGRLDNRERGER